MILPDKPLHHRRVLITRPAGGNAEFQTTLEQAGAQVEHCPLIETVAISFPFPNSLKAYAGIWFSSAVAINSFLSHRNCPSPNEWPKNIPFFAVGDASAKTLTSFGYGPVYTPPSFNATAAIQHWLKQGLWQTGTTLIWPCGNLANQAPLKLAQLYGVSIDPLEVYQTQMLPALHQDAQRCQQLAPLADVIVFTSPSAVECFVQIMGSQTEHLKSTVACLGPSTERAAQDLLGKVDLVANPSTLKALAQKIITLYTIN